MNKLEKDRKLKVDGKPRILNGKKDKLDLDEVISKEIEDKIKIMGVGNNFKRPEDIVEWYWVDKPFAAVVIVKEDIGYSYQVITPSIGSLHFEVLNRSYYQLVERVSLAKVDPSIIFEKEALKVIRSYIKANKVDEYKLLYYLKRKSLGYDSIDPLFKDPMIEDISCNGPNLPIFVYHVNYGFIPTNIIYDKEYLDDFVSHLAELADRHISIGEPIVEASLRDGSRLTALWRREVSDRGSSFAIRKIRVEPFSSIDLVRLGTFNSKLMALLWLLVEFGANMLIIGGTASGKTTTLNATCFFIPKNKRIVSIEDTRELRLMHENWVPLVVREEKKVGHLKTGLDAMYLLKSALRMRPEYLIVGEVRGEEARILFQAMNTGHIVYSTLHAGTVEEAFIRLFNPPISVPPAMIVPLDIAIVQSLVQLGDKEVRRCVYVGEIKEINIQDKEVDFLPLYRWDSKNDKIVKINVPKRTFEKIKRMRGWDENEILAEVSKRTSLLEGAISRGIRGHVDFIKFLKSYNKLDLDLKELH